MNVTFHPVSSEQKTNNDVLRQGVVGVECLKKEQASKLTFQDINDEQLEALALIDNTLMKTVGLYMGTVEIYANGAMNVFIRDGKEVVRYVTVRS